MVVLSKDRQEKRTENSDSTWEIKGDLGDFFSVLGKIDSSGISAIITREEKKKTDEGNKGNQ